MRPKWMVVVLIVAGGHLRGRELLSFADVVERTLPGVVNIRAKKYVRRSPELDLYRFFLDGAMPRTESSASLGSGVVISSNGEVITNYHVVQHATEIKILFADAKTLSEANLIGVDRKSDLALLRLRDTRSTVPLTLGDSDRLRVGDIAIAIGNPFGYSHTVTQGIISAKGRVLGAGPFDSFLQTDAGIHPGNSGGPLLDVRGRVVGINSAVSSQGSGIGFAIPANLVQRVVDELRSYGKVKRPWLGIVGRNIVTNDKLYGDSSRNGLFGVFVSNLIAGGPAHRAGLALGDLILEFGFEAVRDLNTAQQILAARQIGESLAVTVYRRGEGYLKVQLEIAETPPPTKLPDEADLF